MKRVAFAVLAAGAVASTGVCAATVQKVTGKVSLNKGSGFKTVAGKAAAAPGDQVMAGDGGSGQIVYDDGCAIEVKPGKVYVVKETSPCESGLGLGMGDMDYVIVGGAVAGATIGIVALADDDDSGKKKKTKPASP